MERKAPYPFTAIVGQEDMKLALLLNVINPLIGGVLIKGEKGTAKSTAVRAVADLLPPLKMVAHCAYQCDPDDESNLCVSCREALEETGQLEVVERPMKVVELPVSATEDRVVGTLDMEQAIKKGEKHFEPGLLAQGNRNILYVDEINLLDDHVVDVLLDAAAMGINTVEREGVSYSHPARFTLVGTMNPEEGDIRPQLLDRFGLSISIAGEEDPEKRVEVIKRRLAYEKDPHEFCASYKEQQQELSQQIEEAKKRLESVAIDDELLLKVAQLSIVLQVDGHRADITVIKTAKTIAAFEGRNKVLLEDIEKAISLVLPHRMRRKPFEEERLDWEEVTRILHES